MHEQPSLRSRLATLASWLLAVIAVAAIASFAWYIPHNRIVFRGIYRDLKVELPPSTQIMLAIPACAIYCAGAFLILIVAAVQWFVRTSTTRASFHMIVIVFCEIVLVLYRESLFGPMVNLVRSLSARPVQLLIPQ